MVMKLIKNWKELNGIHNDKYKVVVDFKYCCGWIIPINDDLDDNGHLICKCSRENYFEKHKYLSTHTFYGKHYKYSSELLQSFGFDVEIDNWDKKVVK